MTTSSYQTDCLQLVNGLALSWLPQLAKLVSYMHKIVSPACMVDFTKISVTRNKFGHMVPPCWS